MTIVTTAAFSVISQYMSGLNLLGLFLLAADAAGKWFGGN